MENMYVLVPLSHLKAEYDKRMKSFEGGRLFSQSKKSDANMIRFVSELMVDFDRLPSSLISMAKENPKLQDEINSLKREIERLKCRK